MTTYPSVKYSGGQACRVTPSKPLKETCPDGYKYPKRPKVNGKLTPFIPALLLALDFDSLRPKRDRRTALMLFEAIKKDGYTGGYSILTDYVRNWRIGLIPGSGKSAFVPLKFQLGEAFQFDWSEEALMIGGIHRKIQAAHTKLCASRAFCLSAYPTQTQDMLYDAHTRAFTALVGITKRGISATAPALLYLLHPCSRMTL